jgi:hypothetical protein
VAEILGDAEILLGDEVEYPDEKSLVPSPLEGQRVEMIPMAFQEALARALELASQRNAQLTEALQLIADQKAAIQDLERRQEELEAKMQQAGSSRELDGLRNRMDILENWQGRSWLARLFGWW